MPEYTDPIHIGDQFNLRTPWEDFDLDVFLKPTRRTLRLPAPAFYLSILPVHLHDNHLEATWNNSTCAFGLRSTLRECMEYERLAAREIASLSLQMLSSPHQPSTSSSGMMMPLETPTDVPLRTTKQQSISLNILRKRNRDTSTENAQTSTRRTKRIKHAPERLGPKDRLAADDAVNEIVKEMTSATKHADTDVAHAKPSEVIPSLNDSWMVVMSRLHSKVYEALEKLYTLVTNAEGIEYNTMFLRAKSDLTISSLNQSLMSKEELEVALLQMQGQAEKVVMELEYAALALHSAIGTSSTCLAQFKALDTRNNYLESYDLEIEWQIKRMGLVRWWSNGF